MGTASIYFYDVRILGTRGRWSGARGADDLGAISSGQVVTGYV